MMVNQKKVGTPKGPGLHPFVGQSKQTAQDKPFAVEEEMKLFQARVRKE